MLVNLYVPVGQVIARVVQGIIVRSAVRLSVGCVLGALGVAFDDF